MDFAVGVPLSRLPRAERRVGSQPCFVVTALSDGVPSVASKKLHDVIVRRKRAVAGYPQLLARLENAYKAKSQDERQAQAVALMALSFFLVANGKDGPIPIWLLKLASSLTDPNYGKALPSNVWRKVALISLGMKALTMGRRRPRGGGEASTSCREDDWQHRGKDAYSPVRRTAKRSCQESGRKALVY